MKPAWSWQFEEGTLLPVLSAWLPVPVTREWAWEGSDGAGVKVAVIDSGIDEQHPQVGPLAGAVALEYDSDAPEQVRATEGPHEDLVGHGTACAAIIRQVAPAAELYSVRVLGAKLTGKALVFAAGLRWAMDNGIHVANLSLSTSRREHFAMFHDLTDEAYFKGMILVSAVNNVPAPSYPSQYATVFSVAAHDRLDPYGFDYNPAPPVEFGAPGIDVDVAWLGGGTIRATGNSFAAPHVAGLVTKILGKHPGLTPFQMKTLLHAVADNASRQ